jgi:hypothetical protein
MQNLQLRTNLFPLMKNLTIINLSGVLGKLNRMNLIILLNQLKLRATYLMEPNQIKAQLSGAY